MLKHKFFALTLVAVMFLSSALLVHPASAAILVKGGQWSNTSRLIEDTCGGASQGATFPVTITNRSADYFKLTWFAQVFGMTRVNGDTFKGKYTNLNTGATYYLTLTFDSSTHYQGKLEVKFPNCANGHWLFLWVGQAI
jgi:hypothetical protein